jgi:hypothetical protein
MDRRSSSGHLVRDLSSVAPPWARRRIREFEAAARRPLRERMKWAFIHTHKPVMEMHATGRSAR